MLSRNSFDLFDDMFDSSFLKKERINFMKTDILESENSYFIKIDLPGYNKDAIKLDFENGYLTIHASVNNEKDYEKDYEKDLKVIKKERYVGNCYRSFYIGEINEENIKATFKNGTLEILILKNDPSKIQSNKKYIEIESKD